MMRRVLMGVVAVSLALVSPDAAWAAALIFDDTVSGFVTVFANDFEGGSTLNGNAFQSGLGNPQSSSVPGRAR